MAKQVQNKRKAKPNANTANNKSKSDLVIGLLRRKNGATLEDLQQVTQWQAHSVRGFCRARCARSSHFL